MTALLSALYRDVGCAMTAALITVVVGFAFVHSTSVPPGMQHVVQAATAPHADQA